tara:strand:- start:87 stop:470 length:384 start_codon:yes stop_codon:yes gene_type:complete
MARGYSEHHNKKGQGLSMNAITVIVLGLFVLAVLILGFTKGWGITGLIIFEEDNIDDLRATCEIACNDKFNFCSFPREIRLNEDALKSANINLINTDYLKSGDKKTCNELYIKYPRIGIKRCSGGCD